MKVLGICGSPRRSGNTETLLDKILLGAGSKGSVTEKVVLSDLDISPCREEEYETVNEDGLSIINDDIHLIFRKIKEADCIIVASPIFFGSLSAQTKTMIDRFQCVWIAREILKKKIFAEGKMGAFLAASGSTREDFFENARSIVRHFFAVIGIKYKEGLFCGGLDAKGDVLKHPEYLEKAFGLGKGLANNSV